MNTGTGELHTDMSEETAKKLGLTPISEKEHKAAIVLPPVERPVDLFFKRFISSLTINPDTILKVKLKQAFRFGINVGKQNPGINIEE